MSTQNKIAIDIVLLLPEEINILCYDINATSNKKEYVDFKDGYNPHITLGMGCILKSELENFKNDLEILLKDQKFLDLQIIGFDTGKPAWLSIHKSVELRNLHNNIFNLIKKYSKYTANKEDFFEIEEIFDSLVNWVNTFEDKQSGDKYDPHISIGKDIHYIFEKEISFKAGIAGLFQIGKHGTCKNELARFMLK
ncbi:MAG: hypothetical protein KBB88_02975 [Candidatus Pacebacteria bacterium]|nr:hypothetical protein [Candidatus Paceibacterota bacterium]